MRSSNLNIEIASQIISRSHLPAINDKLHADILTINNVCGNKTTKTVYALEKLIIQRVSKIKRKKNPEDIHNTQTTYFV